MLLAFNEPIDIIGSKYSLREIRMKIRLKFAELNTKALQDYEIMAKILSAAFGSKKKGKTVQTKDELKQIISKIG